MKISSKNLTVYFIEKVPGDILKGLGWVKMDYDIAQRLQIPIKYSGTISVPNPEPYCCQIHPEDKLPWYTPNYQPVYYVYPPKPQGKSKKFTLHIKGENITLYVQSSLTIEAIRLWLVSWADEDVQLITPGKRAISLEGNVQRSKAFIYFVLNSDSYAIKIGRAASVEKRLQSLQTSSPVPLQVLKVIPVESLKKAKEVEAYLHAKFDYLRMSGEWFKADPQLKDYIASCDSSYFKETLSVKPRPRRSIRLSEL
jgi:hypothetical protein